MFSPRRAAAACAALILFLAYVLLTRSRPLSILYVDDRGTSTEGVVLCNQSGWASVGIRERTYVLFQVAPAVLLPGPDRCVRRLLGVAGAIAGEQGSDTWLWKPAKTHSLGLDRSWSRGSLGPLTVATQIITIGEYDWVTSDLSSLEMSATHLRVSAKFSEGGSVVCCPCDGNAVYIFGSVGSVWDISFANGHTQTITCDGGGGQRGFAMWSGDPAIGIRGPIEVDVQSLPGSPESWSICICVNPR
jgi:hypothetical protein